MPEPIKTPEQLQKEKEEVKIPGKAKTPLGMDAEPRQIFTGEKPPKRVSKRRTIVVG